MQNDSMDQRRRFHMPLQRKELPTMKELIIPNSPRIPGYQGFLPGERDHIAESFGRFPLNQTNGESHPGKARAEETLPEVHSLDKSIHLDHGRRIPGYKGHVPGTKTVYATTFSASTEEALQQTLAKMQLQEYHQNALPQIHLKLKENDTRNRVILPSQPEAPCSNIPPGYTGYLPNSQYHYGHTYGDLVRKVDEFHGCENTRSRCDPLENEPVTQRRHINYHIPGYTGYIQEHMYDYGKTFAKMTEDHMDYPRSIFERNKVAAVPLPPLGPAERRALEAKIVFSDAARIPGYTGALPRIRDEYGSTFGKMSRVVLDSLHGKEQSHPIKLPSLPKGHNESQDEILEVRQVVATTEQQKQQPIIPSIHSLPSLKPHPPLDPQRTSQSARQHISGYTGFVPSRMSRVSD